MPKLIELSHVSLLQHPAKSGMGIEPTSCRTLPTLANVLSSIDTSQFQYFKEQ